MLSDKIQTTEKYFTMEKLILATEFACNKLWNVNLSSCLSTYFEGCENVQEVPCILNSESKCQWKFQPRIKIIRISLERKNVSLHALILMSDGTWVIYYNPTWFNTFILLILTRFCFSLLCNRKHISRNSWNIFTFDPKLYIANSVQKFIINPTRIFMGISAYFE